MAMLLEKRQSNVLLFAADQKDPFFSPHLLCILLAIIGFAVSMSQVFPAAALVEKPWEGRLVFQNPVLFF